MRTNRKTRTHRLGMFSSVAAALTMNASALAGGVATNASAGSNPFGPGTASAGASATGSGRNYAKTDSRTGNMNLARGVALSVDHNGISFSASNAIAGRLGPAVATNFNLSIGRDGSVASSHGVSVAKGGLSREVSAGGFAGNRPGPATAGSTAGGRTTHGGTVFAKTDSRSSPPRWRW